MAGSRMKTGLVEIIVLYFTVPAVDHRFWTRRRLAGGPKGVQVLPKVRIVAVHQLVGAGELFRIALCHVVDLRAEYQWGHTMLGPVDIVLLQGHRTKARQVELTRGAGVDACASDQAQDDPKEYGAMPTHIYLHVNAGGPGPLHRRTDDIHGAPSHNIKDTIVQKRHLESKALQSYSCV
jgi:hypothetical protein